MMMCTRKVRDGLFHLHRDANAEGFHPHQAETSVASFINQAHVCGCVRVCVVGVCVCVCGEPTCSAPTCSWSWASRVARSSSESESELDESPLLSLLAVLLLTSAPARPLGDVGSAGSSGILAKRISNTS